MSANTDADDGSEIEQTPNTEGSTNGEVRIVLDISDPVLDLGIRTDTVSVESNGKVSEELAQHIWDELFINVEEHDIEVFD